jgi:hypothetical protein
MRFLAFADKPREDNGASDKQVHLSVSGTSVILTEVSTGSSVTVGTELFKPKTKYVVFLSKLYGLKVFEHDWLYKEKGNFTVVKEHWLATEVVANLYFHNTSAEFVVFCNYQPVYEDGSIELTVVPPGRVHDIIGGLYPDSENSMAHNTNLRIEHLAEINLVDSVVALEQQVDLLTDLVKALLNAQSAPAWAAAFIAGVEEHSTKTVKNPTDIVNNIKSHKAFVRDVQSAYFRNRK